MIIPYTFDVLFTIFVLFVTKFLLQIGPDMKNSNEYIVHIDQSTLGLPAREYYLEDSNLKFLRAYKVFMLSIANLMDAEPKQAEDDVEDIVKFETKLARIMASPEERRNISEIYLRFEKQFN